MSNSDNAPAVNGSFTIVGPVLRLEQVASAASSCPAVPQAALATWASVTCARTTRTLSIRSVSAPTPITSGASTTADNARFALADAPIFSAVGTEKLTGGSAPFGDVSPQATAPMANADAVRARDNNIR